MYSHITSEVEELSSKNEWTKKIITESTLLFAQKGYERTSINEICKAVGISKGGLNYYFRAKEEILIAIHEKFIDYELDSAKRIIDKNLSPEVRLKELIEALMESIFRFLPHCIVFFHSKNSLSEKNIKQISVKRKQYAKIFYECIKEGCDMGIFDSSYDIEMVNYALFGMCNYSLNWLDVDGRLNHKEIADIFYKMITNGITAKN